MVSQAAVSNGPSGKHSQISQALPDGNSVFGRWIGAVGGRDVFWGNGLRGGWKIDVLPRWKHRGSTSIEPGGFMDGVLCANDR